MSVDEQNQHSNAPAENHIFVIYFQLTVVKNPHDLDEKWRLYVYYCLTVNNCQDLLFFATNRQRVTFEKTFWYCGKQIFMNWLKLHVLSWIVMASRTAAITLMLRIRVIFGELCSGFFQLYFEQPNFLQYWWFELNT